MVPEWGTVIQMFFLPGKKSSPRTGVFLRHLEKKGRPEGRPRYVSRLETSDRPGGWPAWGEIYTRDFLFLLMIGSGFTPVN